MKNNSSKPTICHLAPLFTEEMNDSCWVSSKYPLLHLCRGWHRDVPATTITIWKRWDRRLPKCVCDPALTLQEWLVIIEGNLCGKSDIIENVTTKQG